MKKAFGFLWMMLLLVGTATLVVYHLNYSTTFFNPAGMVSIGGNMNVMTLTMLRRKLKENMNPPSEDKYYTNDVNLQDYRPIDPVPSSTYSLQPGPIMHGTPLMPYVPGPSPPPDQGKHNEFP